MKISILLLALVAGSFAANIDLAEPEQELQDTLIEDDDTDEEDNFEEDDEQSSLLNSLTFLQGRTGVCAGMAKGSCSKKGGECVTAPFPDNCKAIHGDAGKLKKQSCKSKDCQCCVPPPSCYGKIKKSCSKNGGSCIVKPFKSNCKGGTLDKKSCKGKHCQCCIPGITGGNGDTTVKPDGPTTTPAPPTTTISNDPAPTTTPPPPPPPTTTPAPPPTTISNDPAPTTTPPPPPTTTPPPPPTTTPPPPPTTTPPPPPTTTPPPPPTTTPPPPPTTTPPPPPTTTPPPPPTTTEPLPPTTTVPPPQTSLGRGCSSGRLVGGQCLIFGNDELTHGEAKQRCASLNGHLASIDDPQVFIDYINTHYDGVRFWLGGSDAAEEGNWVWQNGRPFGDSFPWGSNEPNNAGGNQQCLVAGHGRSYDDGTCSSKFRFVCNQGCTSGVLLKGQCLTVSTEQLSWNDAKERCSSNNGALASLNDPQAFHDHVNRNHNGERFWLGGSDGASEGNWEWLNGKPFNQFPWGSNEPNNWGGNQHCLLAGWNGNYDDGTCDDKFGFVCVQGCTSGELVKGQCLTFSTEELNWPDSKEKCSSQNQALASLDDPQGFRDYINKNYDGQRFWLGGSDGVNEGSWMWMNGQSFQDDFPWGNGEPNNWGGNQNCLVGGHGGSYDDGTCSTKFRFVCN